MLRSAPRRFQSKTRIVNDARRKDNNGMNLFLALFWLICAVVLFAYEQFVSGERFLFEFGHLRIPGVYLMLALTVYNFIRWWAYRSYRAKRRLEEIARAQEEWERRRHRTAPPQPLNPNFNFTDEPPSSNGLTDRPPSHP